MAGTDAVDGDGGATQERRGTSGLIDRVRASAREVAERHALPICAAGTVLLLLAIFYYPVATVFRESVVVDGRATLSVFWAVLADPFYFGELARVLTGTPPSVVLDSLLSGDPRLGVVGFTAYQAALSSVASVALGLPAAYLLSRYEFPGRRTLRSLTILPFVLPSIMVAVGFVATFGQNGTLNTVLRSASDRSTCSFRWRPSSSPTRSTTRRWSRG